MVPILKDGASIIFYEDLPYAGDYERQDIAAFADQISSNCNIKLFPFEIDTGISAEAKISAISVYKSQLDESTITRIETHGKRQGGFGVVERLWGSRSSLRLFESIMEARS